MMVVESRQHSKRLSAEKFMDSASIDDWDFSIADEDYVLLADAS